MPGRAAGVPSLSGFPRALSNDGERLTLLDAGGESLRAFTYNDQLPWPTAADGSGFSLVLVAPASNPDHADPLNWRPSSNLHGTPGHDDAIAFSGLPNADDDSDGLDALVEHALGSSDANGASGLDRIGNRLPSGESGLTHTLNLAANDVRLIVEISTDLLDWSMDPGDGSVVRLVARTHNGDGTETLAWQPAIENARVFARLRVNLNE